MIPSKLDQEPNKTPKNTKQNANKQKTNKNEKRKRTDKIGLLKNLMWDVESKYVKSLVYIFWIDLSHNFSIC